MSEINWDIDTAVKETILKERVNKLAQDGYQVELNYQFAVSQGNSDAAEKFKTSMNGIKASLEFHREELKKLQS